MAVNQWTGNVGAPARINPQPIRLYNVPDGTLADRQLGGFSEGASGDDDLDFSADGTRLVAAVDRFDQTGHECSTPVPPCGVSTTPRSRCFGWGAG